MEMLQALDAADITFALGNLGQEEEIPWTLAATPVPEVEAVLRSADSWGFDAFRWAAKDNSVPDVIEPRILDRTCSGTQNQRCQRQFSTGLHSATHVGLNLFRHPKT